MKNRKWIESELLCDWGFREPFEHVFGIFTGRLSQTSYRDSNIVREILSSVTNWGAPSDIFTIVCGDHRGVWFYAGWHDQASLHVGTVVAADIRMLPQMSSQIEIDPIDECGDSMIGYASIERDWILTLDVSPERRVFTVSLRPNFEEDIDHAKKLLGL